MLKTLLRGLFPTQCVICRKNNQWLCPDHHPLPSAPPNQVRYKYLDTIWAVTAYNDPIIKTVIEHLKFKYFRQLAKPIAQEIKAAVSPDFWKESTIVPIPLHWRRQLWRGFNQSEHIARAIGPTNTSLKRTKHTAQQARLSKLERLKNIKGAFAWQSQDVPKNIILIDDVVASGQTLDEAAKVLKEAGALEVKAVVFARGG